MGNPIIALQSSPLSSIITKHGFLPNNVAAYLPGSEATELAKFSSAQLRILRRNTPNQVVCADVDCANDPWADFESFLAAHQFSIPCWEEVMEADSFAFAIEGRRYRPEIAAAALKDSELFSNVQIVLNASDLKSS